MLDGGLGADILIGGSGSDTASYARATAAVTVFLDESQGTNTVIAAGDTYSSIETLTGAIRNDTLHSDAGDNIIDGGQGIDTLHDGAGDDIYLANADSGTGTVVDPMPSWSGSSQTLP